MLRLPQNRNGIENRASDMCMNLARLAMAMTTAAALAGVTGRRSTGRPLDRDLYTIAPEELAKRGIRRLPRHLLEAVENLRTRSPLALDVFGEVMHNSYSRYKTR